QMYAILPHEIGGDGRTYVDYQTCLVGEEIRPHHCQPAVHAQSVEIVVSVAYATQLPGRLCDLAWQSEDALESRCDCIGFLLAAHTDQSCAPQGNCLLLAKGGQHRLFIRGQPGANTALVDKAPLDQGVSAVQLKNHGATSGSIRRH